MSWTPLYNTIVGSSLWDEKLHVRVVFLTMLAMKDFQGHVRGYTARSFARQANVSRGECEEAIRILSEPDKFRPDQEYDGRRIEPLADGDGWLVLNHAKYVGKMGAHRRTYQKAYQKWRRAHEKALKRLIREADEMGRRDGAEAQIAENLRVVHEAIAKEREARFPGLEPKETPFD